VTELEAPPRQKAGPPKPGAGPSEAFLLPRLYLHRGYLVLPDGEDLPLARDPAGEPLDIFDVADAFFGRYHGIYVVDLDGVRSGRPQFDLLQEISRGQEMWVDAGPRNADQVMDVLVAGATRAVVSTRTLGGLEEIPAIVQITGDFALEIPIREGEVLFRRPGNQSRDPRGTVEASFAGGVPVVLLELSDQPVDWAFVRSITERGAIYVNGAFGPEVEGMLRSAGARGGVFTPRDGLKAWRT
jgi:hypothetical protein